MAEEKKSNCLDYEYFDIGLTKKGCYTRSDNKIYAYTSAYLKNVKNEVIPITGVPQVTIGIANNDVYEIFSAMTLQQTCYQKTCLIALTYTDLLEDYYRDYINENQAKYNSDQKEYNQNIIIYCLYLALCCFEFQINNKEKTYFKAYFPIKPRTLPYIKENNVKTIDIVQILMKEFNNKEKEHVRDNIVNIVNSDLPKEKQINYEYIYYFNENFQKYLKYLLAEGNNYDLFDLGYNNENKTIIEFRNVSDLYTYVDQFNNYKPSKHINILQLQSVIIEIIDYISELVFNKEILTWGVEFETPLIFNPKIYRDFIKDYIDADKVQIYKEIPTKRIRLKDQEFVHANNTRHTGSTVNIIPINGGENSPSLEFTPEIQKLDTRHNEPYKDCDGKKDDIKCTKHIGNLEFIFGIFTNTDDDKQLFINYCTFIYDMFINRSNFMALYKIRNIPKQSLGKSMRVSVKRRKHSKHRKINKRNMGKYRHSKRCVCKAK